MSTAAEIIQELQAPELIGALKTLVWLRDHGEPGQLLEPSGDCILFDQLHGTYWTAVAYVGWLIKKGLAEHVSPGDYGYGQINLTELGRDIATALAVSDELEGKETVP